MRYEGQSCAGVVRSRRSAAKKQQREHFQRAEPTVARTELNISPSHSVNVRLYSCGEVKVDDIGDILEIDTSGDSKLFVLTP